LVHVALSAFQGYSYDALSEKEVWRAYSPPRIPISTYASGFAARIGGKERISGEGLCLSRSLTA
jgi:hypothetical protein